MFVSRLNPEIFNNLLTAYEGSIDYHCVTKCELSDTEVYSTRSCNTEIA